MVCVFPVLGSGLSSSRRLLRATMISCCFVPEKLPWIAWLMADVGLTVRLYKNMASDVPIEVFPRNGAAAAGAGKRQSRWVESPRLCRASHVDDGTWHLTSHHMIQSMFLLYLVNSCLATICFFGSRLSFLYCLHIHHLHILLIPFLVTHIVVFSNKALVLYLCVPLHPAPALVLLYASSSSLCYYIASTTLTPCLQWSRIM